MNKLFERTVWVHGSTILWMLPLSIPAIWDASGKPMFEKVFPCVERVLKCIVLCLFDELC